MRNPLFRIVLIATMICSVALAVFLLDRLTTIYGVGAADVELQFVVTDSETGEPVRGAIVDVWWDDSRNPPAKEERFITDDNGAAIYRPGECRFSQESTLFRSRTSFDLPGACSVNAKGYHPFGRISMSAVPRRIIGKSSTQEGLFMQLQVPTPLVPLAQPKK
jgi:hypothetical protein